MVFCVAFGPLRLRSSRVSRPSAPYQRTAAALAELIDQSEPGSYLPSEPALAEQFGVSRATLREAMRAFEDRGWVERRQGVGTLVRPRVIDAGLEQLISIDRLAERIGLEVSMGELEIERRLERWEIARVILAEGRPVAFLVDIIAPDLISEVELEREFHGSVLDLLLARGRPELDVSKTKITAVAADPAIARRLGVPPGAVLLRLDGRLYDRQGQVVDRSTSYFLPGTFRFHVLRRVEPGRSIRR